VARLVWLSLSMVTAMGVIGTGEVGVVPFLKNLVLVHGVQSFPLARIVAA